MNEKQFGAFVRERRLALGLRQKDVAVRLGRVSITYVCQIEHGRNAVGERLLWKLADALELDPFALHALVGKIPNGCVPQSYERAEAAAAAFRASSRCGPRNPCQEARMSFSGHSE